ANPVQAWNLSAFPLLVQSMLGLMPLAPRRVLALDPILPDWLPEVEVRGLRVGDAAVSLRVTRRGDAGRADDAAPDQQAPPHGARAEARPRPRPHPPRLAARGRGPRPPRRRRRRLPPRHAPGRRRTGGLRGDGPAGHPPRRPTAAAGRPRRQPLGPPRRARP